MFRKKNLHEEVRCALKPLYPRLWRFARVLTGSEDWASELTQMTCLRALEKSDYFSTGTKIDRWVFKIAQNLWISELRKRVVRQGNGLVAADEIEISDNKAGPEMNLLGRQALSEVMALPEAQRVAVMLVYIEGYSYKEASETLEIPIGTVMSRLSAARTKLAAKLNKEAKTG